MMSSPMLIVLTEDREIAGGSSSRFRSSNFSFPMCIAYLEALCGMPYIWACLATWRIRLTVRHEL